MNAAEQAWVAAGWALPMPPKPTDEYRSHASEDANQWPVRANNPWPTVDDVPVPPALPVMAEQHVANVNGVDLVRVKRVARQVEKDIALAGLLLVWLAVGVWMVAR